MRNRLLQITRSVIAYLPELKPYTGSVVGCLLMQQMDFWFNQKPDGFYKFLSPSEHPDYRDGDSWTEELAISEAEFRTAIDRICHRWPSKSAFDAADDKFQGKFYCSVYDRRRQLTTYFRNHPLVDACLDELAERNSVRGTPGRGEGSTRDSSQGAHFPRQNGPQPPVFAVSQDRQLPVTEESSFPVNQGSSVTGNASSLLTVTDASPVAVAASFQALGNEDLPSEQLANAQLQETRKQALPKTEKPLSNNLKQPQQLGSCSSDLIFPNTLTPTEKTAIKSMLVGCVESLRQDVLDELAGYKSAGAIRTSAIALTRQLIEAVKNGTFVVNRGATVRDARLAAQSHAARIAAASTVSFDESEITAEALDRLPPAIRARTLAQLNRGKQG